MPTTQRVLSGSRTQGSTATPTGSIIYSYQGIYAKSDASYFGSLLPRIGSGDRTKLYKGSKPAADTPYDDSISMNNDTADMPGGEDAPLTVRISFDLERMTIGQAPTTQQGDKFVDINGFDPVTYLHDPGTIMWPVNLWNLGSLPEETFNGVIEPLDIRREILGLSGKYSGHKVRGANMGSFADSARGGRKIRDVRRLTANPPQPFFDGPDQVRSPPPPPGGEAWTTGSVPVAARLAQPTLSASAWTDPTSVQPLQSYQGLYDEVEAPFIDRTYFDVVYSKLSEHNPQGFRDIAAGQVGVYNLTENWSTDTTPPFLYVRKDTLVTWLRMKADVSSTGNMPNNAYDPVTDFEGTFDSASERPGYVTNTYPGTPNAYIAPACADFDGVDDIMKVDGGSGNDTWNDLIGGSYAGNDLKPWSLSVWIMVDNFDSDSNHFIFNASSADYANSAGVSINRTTNNADEYVGSVSAFRYGGGSWVRNGATSTAGLITAGNWHHVVVAYAGTFNPSGDAPEQFSIYVDGVSCKSGETGYDQVGDAPTDFSANYIHIGGSPSFGGRDYFNGKISDVAIWSRALNQNDVTALYNMATYGPDSADQNWVIVEEDMTARLRVMSSSMNESIDPLNERSNHGFYFGKKAGSIVYGDW